MIFYCLCPVSIGLFTLLFPEQFLTKHSVQQNPNHRSTWWLFPSTVHSSWSHDRPWKKINLWQERLSHVLCHKIPGIIFLNMERSLGTLRNLEMISSLVSTSLYPVGAGATLRNEAWEQPYIWLLLKCLMFMKMQRLIAPSQRATHIHLQSWVSTTSRTPLWCLRTHTFPFLNPVPP